MHGHGGSRCGHGGGGNNDGGCIHIGNIEEGSVKMVGKYKSLLSRWYVLKGGLCPKKVHKAPDEAVHYIERDRLVMVKCKRGDRETIENYRVLSIFNKHSNK